MRREIAFTIFGLEIRWYGVLIAVAILLAGLISYKKAKVNNINEEIVFDIILWSVPAGIIGARLYYVIFQWDYYGNNLSEIFMIRNGGLAIHGGLIFGILTGYLVCKAKKVDFLNLADLVVPQIALAQAIGRWGNYFNGEAHGGPTNLPWAIEVNGQMVHPTFLYESIWCLILFFFLSYMFKRKRVDGQVVCLYGFLYSLERFFVEGLRTDSLMIGGLRQAQVFSVLIMISCVIIYFVLLNRSKLIDKNGKEEK